MPPAVPSTAPSHLAWAFIVPFLHWERYTSDALWPVLCTALMMVGLSGMSVPLWIPFKARKASTGESWSIVTGLEASLKDSNRNAPQIVTTCPKWRWVKCSCKKGTKFIQCQVWFFHPVLLFFVFPQLSLFFCVNRVSLGSCFGFNFELFKGGNVVPGFFKLTFHAGELVESLCLLPCFLLKQSLCYKCLTCAILPSPQADVTYIKIGIVHIIRAHSNSPLGQIVIGFYTLPQCFSVTQWSGIIWKVPAWSQNQSVYFPPSLLVAKST